MSLVVFKQRKDPSPFMQASPYGQGVGRKLHSSTSLKKYDNTKGILSHTLEIPFKYTSRPDPINVGLKDGKETLEIKMRLSRKSVPTYHVCNNKSNCHKQVSYLLKEIGGIVK